MPKEPEAKVEKPRTSPWIWLSTTKLGWVDLCDQVVRRMRYPDAAPEAWAMENPRRGGPPLYPIRWHTGFFGSFCMSLLISQQF